MQEELREYLMERLKRSSVSKFFAGVIQLEQSYGRSAKDEILKVYRGKAKSCGNHEKCSNFLSEFAATDPHVEAISFPPYTEIFLGSECCYRCPFFLDLD
jgi:hypothetical protein